MQTLNKILLIISVMRVMSCGWSFINSKSSMCESLELFKVSQQKLKDRNAKVDGSMKSAQESLSQYKSGGIYEMKDIGAQVWEDANMRKENAKPYPELQLKSKSNPMGSSKPMEAYFDTDINGFVYEKDSTKLKKFKTNKRPQGFSTEIVLRVVQIFDNDVWNVWENEIRYRSEFFKPDLKGWAKNDVYMNSANKEEPIESVAELQNYRKSVLPKFGYCYRTEIEGTDKKFLYMFYKSMSNNFNEEIVNVRGKHINLIQTFRSQPIAFRIKFYISLIEQVLAYHDNGYVVADYFKISDLYFTDDNFNKGTMISKTVKTGEGEDAYWPNTVCGLVSCYTAPEWITALLAGDTKSSSKLGNIYSLGMMIAEIEFDFFCFALEKGYNKYKSAKYWQNIRALVQARTDFAGEETQLMDFDKWLLDIVNPNPSLRIQTLDDAKERLMGIINHDLDYSDPIQTDVPLVPNDCLIVLENIEVEDEHFGAFQQFFNHPKETLESYSSSMKTDSYKKSMSEDEFQSVQMGFETVKQNPDSVILNSFSSKPFNSKVEKSLQKSALKEMISGSFKRSMNKSMTFEINSGYSSAHQSLMKYQSSHQKLGNGYSSSGKKSSKEMSFQSQQMGFETNQMKSGSMKSQSHNSSKNGYVSSQSKGYSSQGYSSQGYSSQGKQSMEFDTMKMANQNKNGPTGINANRSVKRDLEQNVVNGHSMKVLIKI